MKKSLFCAVCAVLLVGCTSKTPSYEKMQINEPAEAVQTANALVKSKSPSQISKQISDSFHSNNTSMKFNGAKLVDVTSEGASAAYNFDLTANWAEMSNKQKENYLKSFQIMLANSTCNSPSKRILLRHGVKFSHRFFYDYPNQPISQSDVDEAFCVSKGI